MSSRRPDINYLNRLFFATDCAYVTASDKPIEGHSMKALTQFATSAEMAKILCIHPRTLRGMARSGKIPYVRVGRKFLFDRHEVTTHLRRKT
jgi:excisionase family DNA binding protein